MTTHAAPLLLGGDLFFFFLLLFPPFFFFLACQQLGQKNFPGSWAHPLMIYDEFFVVDILDNALFVSMIHILHTGNPFCYCFRCFKDYFSSSVSKDRVDSIECRFHKIIIFVFCLFCQM